MQAVFNYKPVTGFCIAVCLNLLLSVDALAKDDAGKVLRVTAERRLQHSRAKFSR